ncbi:putative POP1-domain-containing protein [Lyophyllum shimeji]|uniref:POP1-domain-containing protein n=1 Tax=Lyophyllum shimeji TaxID=47721 RepID=A0A9P3PM84_LYOSH|nr:putative POP1-domain-containing protein [Lyophyllum shimeji]
MAPKRKDGTDEPTGREKKKQKMAVARTIAVQPVKGVSFAKNAVAGPSKVAINSLKGLPSTIDVERFAEARAFEIDAMHTAMKTASASSTSRAWQALPRHLRRRAASHDVRRVPLRLREKARAEMDAVRKKALGRSMPKLGKNRRLKRTELFARRQRDKLWLETHIWHAKRMKMENMWGYRLAVHPTEKSFRPSHRASIHGSILHDASYYSLIELKGPEFILQKILDSCCDPHGPGPGSKRYSTGSRALETYIYKPRSYPFNLISPVTIIWKPPPSSPVSIVEPLEDDGQQNEATTRDRGPPKRKRKPKGKEKEQTQVLPPSPETIRFVWLRSHPSSYEDVLSALKTSTSLALDAVKREHEGKEFEVELADLRGQVNAFEIMGPKANQVLRGALSPIPQDQRADFKTFWSRLSDVQTSAEFSRGTIVGLKVVDPRLKFPPKNAKVQAPSSEYAPATTVFPSAQLAQSEIWDEAMRASLANPRYKKKDLDERRSKLLIPGAHLTPGRQDDRIPILLIQRSLESPDSNSRGIHGWTVIVPAGWAMAFFSSLTFTGTRVGGQRERQTQAFEAGIPYFPRDLPTSTGYEAYAAARKQEEKSRWERKPPAKRPNFEKLGTSSPWRADWEAVLGLPIGKCVPEDEGMDDEEDLVTTQREQPAVEADVTEAGPRMWLLRGGEVPLVIANISKLFNLGAGLLQEVNRLRAKRGHEPLDPTVKADDLIRGALVSVRVKLCTRGAPEDLATIYSVDDNEAKRWEKVLRNSRDPKIALDEETPEEVELSEIVPPQTSVIGYLTTGHFSLSRGQGYGIGAMPLVKYLALQEQTQRLRTSTTSPNPPLLVKIRNRSGQRCRAAHVEILAT